MTHFFHGTSRIAADAILADGQLFRDACPTYRIEEWFAPLAGTYFSDEWHYAVFYAEQKAKADGSEPVILELDVDDDALVADEDVVIEIVHRSMSDLPRRTGLTAQDFLDRFVSDTTLRETVRTFLLADADLYGQTPSESLGQELLGFVSDCLVHHDAASLAACDENRGDYFMPSFILPSVKSEDGFRVTGAKIDRLSRAMVAPRYCGFMGAHTVRCAEPLPASAITAVHDLSAPQMAMR